MIRRPPRSTLFPSPPLFRPPLLSRDRLARLGSVVDRGRRDLRRALAVGACQRAPEVPPPAVEERESTRLNSSHHQISEAVLCLQKKNRRDVTAPDVQNGLDQ